MAGGRSGPGRGVGGWGSSGATAMTGWLGTKGTIGRTASSLACRRMSLNRNFESGSLSLIKASAASVQAPASATRMMRSGSVLLRIGILVQASAMILDKTSRLGFCEIRSTSLSRSSKIACPHRMPCRDPYEFAELKHVPMPIKKLEGLRRKDIKPA